MTTVRIRLRFPIACPTEVAWRALHSPRVAGSLYAPVVVLAPADPDAALPPAWRPGDSLEVTARILGVVPFGRSVIRVRRAHVTHDGVTHPVFVDAGSPVSGPLALLASWDHRMWVEPGDSGRAVGGAASTGQAEGAIWNDRLTVGGWAAWLLGPGLWVAWQVRGWRLRRLARTWPDQPDLAAG
ncbi:hypothetical protein [Miniimonas arenae]|uniref:hypothetical protein n=1 Tax=Miniimonas arenae TaxID=676201 RepID=UPI0028A6D157|nr:hypothetical protein [Miniimonas arenae]